MHLDLIPGNYVNPVLYKFPSLRPQIPMAGDVAQLLALVSLAAFEDDISEANLNWGFERAKLDLEFQHPGKAIATFWQDFRGYDFDPKTRAYLSYLGFEAYNQLVSRFTANDLWEAIEEKYTFDAIGRVAGVESISSVSNGLLFILLDSFVRKFYKAEKN